MFASIANIFGYLLEFLYNIFNNYGVAIIVFTILIKVLLLPLTIKQQKTMDKSSKLQGELKSLQFKYKNDPEMLQKEMSALYKRENMNPFSGCLSSIIQIILILAVFYMVRSPLTFMKKVDTQIIEDYKTKLVDTTNYPEVEIIKEFGSEDETVYLNMDFFGLDLSNIPNKNYQDFKTLIIPMLYVFSSIISMKMTLKMQEENNSIQVQNEEIKEEMKNEMKKEENAQPPMFQSTSKSMSYMMPVLAFSVSLIAPLGLALYWLVSNLLMIAERLTINIIKKRKGE